MSSSLSLCKTAPRLDGFPFPFDGRFFVSPAKLQLLEKTALRELIFQYLQSLINIVINNFDFQNLVLSYGFIQHISKDIIVWYDDVWLDRFPMMTDRRFSGTGLNQGFLDQSRPLDWSVIQSQTGLPGLRCINPPNLLRCRAKLSGYDERWYTIIKFQDCQPN